MKRYDLLWLLLLPVLWSSCRSDFETVTSTGNLVFSRDTVFLDTVFSNRGSGTYSLKVYNRTNEDISIPRVALGKGEDSKYRLNVDGMPGRVFDDVDILARDSIFIFIEATVNPEEIGETENEFLYTDIIEFSSRYHSQKVSLVTLIRDAVFLYAQRNSDGTVQEIPLPGLQGEEDTRVQGFFLQDKELEFTPDKPYVIYGYATVPSGKTLSIKAGSRIYFHAESGILVSPGASIRSEGRWSSDRELLDEEVIFEGDRLEPRFDAVPGQWGTIWLADGSSDNTFNYTTIKNATVGILSEARGNESPALRLANTQIYNSSSSGILTRNSSVSAENLVINNSGQASLHITQGGSYNFTHCTLTNYWESGYRQYPAVYISNSGAGLKDTIAVDLEIQLVNTVIYGNQSTELLYDLSESAEIDIRISNSLIRFPESADSSASYYDFGDLDVYRELILNEDPQFRAPRKNDLRLKETSPARDKGALAPALAVPQDLLKVNRTTSPDMGAYEWISGEEEETSTN